MLGIDGFSPVVSESYQWTRWQTNFGPFTCAYCAEMSGRIFHKNNPPYPMPGEVHPNCNCTLIVLLCIKAGTATIDGLIGGNYDELYGKFKKCKNLVFIISRIKRRSSFS